MERRQAKSGTVGHDGLLPSPLTEAEWQGMIKAMQVPRVQAAVIGLLIRGCCDKQIATHLKISVATVRTHLHNASARFAAQGRAELMVRVINAGRGCSGGFRQYHQK